MILKRYFIEWRDGTITEISIDELKRLDESGFPKSMLNFMEYRAFRKWLKD
tara:strand:+ start:941 stop:1093 length:153 start_codon:yes stop_codon:yes gene_type:complete